MSNFWTLTIGINQYRFLPGLSYAQRDAEQWHQVLLQTGVSPRRSRLLCDAITVTSGDASFPTEPHIRTQFAALQSVIQPEDVLLIFFSGYGLCVQGKDYLLPIEGDPRQILTTGIAMETLFATLKTLPTQRIVLLLDANRSQVGLEWGGFGEATSQLAHTYGIATLLACQPQQFSHEPLTLRQGIFTTALVNALQQEGCVTLDQVVASLSQQLPRLSEECWRPRQDLLAVVPPVMRHQLICPDPGRTGRAASGSMAQVADRVGAALTKQFAFLSQTSSGLAKTMGGWLNPSQPAALNAEAGTLAAHLAQPFPEPGYAEGESTLSDEFFWRRLLVQGGLIAGILLFGVILRNSNALISGNLSLPQTGNEATFPTQPPAPEAASPSPTDSPASPDLFVDPSLSWEAAQTAFQSQQYEEANRQLSRIPASQRTPEQVALLERTNQELLNQAKTMLIRTREPRSENQVSDLVEAIKMARLVKPGQPLYDEAQQDIDRWSRVILDMAQGRAERPNSDSARETAENYQTAIAAARLVPDDQTNVHPQAKEAIEGWSQRILDLAKQEADGGDLDLAIQIGELIPPYTPVYPLAQEEIAGWRNQPAPTVTESESASAN